MAPVKIACTTHPYGPAADLHQAARDIAAAGADGIVIVCTRTWWRQLDFEAAAALDDFARTLDSLGLALAAVETSSMRTDDPTFNEEEIGYDGYLATQLYAAHPIDPDAWQYEGYRYMRGVMEECGVWEQWCPASAPSPTPAEARGIVGLPASGGQNHQGKDGGNHGAASQSERQTASGRGGGREALSH